LELGHFIKKEGSLLDWITNGSWLARFIGLGITRVWKGGFNRRKGFGKNGLEGLIDYENPKKHL